MATTAQENEGFIDCWNNVLTPKWVRFRHLLSGNGKRHSDIALPRFDIRPGSKVLDIGCGFGEGETQQALELCQRLAEAAAAIGQEQPASREAA